MLLKERNSMFLILAKFKNSKLYLTLKNVEV